VTNDEVGAMTAADVAELTAVQRAGMALIAHRTLVASPVDAFFALHPGDRPLVKAGEAVGRGQPILEQYGDARTIVVAGDASAEGNSAPGERWTQAAARRGREGEATPAGGELLFRSGGNWRIAGGERPHPIEAPFSGVVQSVRPGTGVTVRSAASGILGRAVLAGPTWGRLQIVTDADGELRAQHVDVGAAGAIIVAGARIDAEALTRARAVGIRGVIVAALGIKEQRDFLASEKRGSAAVHGLPPFGILVLDGAARRSIASPIMAMFEALEGSMVAIVGSPPALVADDPALRLPEPPADLVRVRSGPLAGAEGTWAGLAGPRRFPAGVTLEAAFVRFGGRPPVAIPIGDLERFA
jgi:biotin carboxyl carrier protein